MHAVRTAFAAIALASAMAQAQAVPMAPGVSFDADAQAHSSVGAGLATGSDESGAAAGTLIGQDFGLNGPFAYGALVGQVGNGSLFLVGTQYQGVAANSGTLTLFYWDSNSGDNSGFVSAQISAVPEPTSMALLAAGLAIVGTAARRRHV